ncbi:hypothetical protein PQR52_35440, partial [Paraburkholderia aspalathi]
SFFAAAKKVSAAPHRGNANRPLTMQGKARKPEQGKAKALRTRPKSAAQAKKTQANPNTVDKQTTPRSASQVNDSLMKTLQKN